MGFAFVSPLTTQTGSYQSQVVTATNSAVDADTGTITAGSNWSTVRLGQAFAVVRGGAVVAVRCIASASGATLTYYRLYLESGEELPTNIQVGDTIEICEQPDLVGSGGVLNGNGATLTTTGNYLQYATGTTQIRISGFFQLPTSQFLLPSTTVSNTQTACALHTFTGGLMVMGEYVTRGGVTTFASEGLMRHPGAPASPDAAFGIGINACLGVHWFGGTFSGDRVIGVGSSTVAAPTTIYSKNAVLKTVNFPTGSAYQFRTPNNITTYGFTIDGRTLVIIGSNPNIGGLVVRRTTMAVSLGGASPSNQFIPLRGAALKAGNLFCELGMWTNKWYRIINHASGSDCRVGGNLFTTASTANRGLAEFRQEIRGTLLTKQRTAITGAKIFIRDSNNGNRLAANAINNNPSYLEDRTYYMTTNATGVFEHVTDGGVLTAVKYQNLAQLAVLGFEGVVEDYRSPSNSNEDLFDYHMVAYGYSPLSLSANFKGTVAADLSTTLDADTDITESSLSTVLAYTSIDTQAKFYDRAQAWLTESSDNQELAGLGNQLVTLANDTLQLGARNLVVDATATSAFSVSGSTITVKASTLTANVKTTGTVTLQNGATVNGVILDANNAGAISVTGVGVSDTAEMRKASDNSLIASRTGSGAFSVSPANVGVSVYFVRLVGSNIVMSTITTPVTLTAGVNAEVAMFAGAEVQVAQAADIETIKANTGLIPYLLVKE